MTNSLLINSYSGLFLEFNKKVKKITFFHRETTNFDILQKDNFISKIKKRTRLTGQTEQTGETGETEQTGQTEQTG